MDISPKYQKDVIKFCVKAFESSGYNLDSETPYKLTFKIGSSLTYGKVNYSVKVSKHTDKLSLTMSASKSKWGYSFFDEEFDAFENNFNNLTGSLSVGQ